MSDTKNVSEEQAVTSSSDKLMDNILSQLSADVNKNVEELKGLIENNISLNTLTFLNDLTIQNTPIEFAKKTKITDEVSDVGKMNRAYTDLLTRAREDKLTDSFRHQETKEIKSRTETAFTETLASFGRYMSILQASA